MSLKEDIENWDGKSADAIAKVYSTHCSSNSFTTELTQLAGDTVLEVGTTWLIKRHFEASGKFSATEIKRLYSHLPKFEHWEAKLHILQSMPYMPIPTSAKKTVEQFVRANIISSNKFVKAWAYNGFYELAVQFPEYQKEATRFFEMAMQDEPASVKARVRKILAKGF